MNKETSIQPVEGVDAINKRLLDHYGDDLCGHVNYRLVWSTSQYEIRNNDPAGFNIFSSDGMLFLRTEFGPHEVEKYPMHQDMWVLEAIQENIGSKNELLANKFSYEPLWVFGAGKSNPQPMWAGIEFLVKAHKFRDKVRILGRTERDALREEAAQLAKEKEICKQYLQNESPYIPGMLHNGSAVTVPNKEFKVGEV